MTDTPEDGTDADDKSVRVFGGGDGGNAWSKLEATEFSGSRRSQTTKAISTQQADTDDPHGQPEWYDPPYPPTNLLLLLERSETHATCVHAKSQGVAGHGFDIVPHESVETEDPPGEETVREFWEGTDSTWQLGVDKLPATPAEVLEHAWDDYESIGWLAIEVLRNGTTMEPTGLAHVPAHTIRKRKDRPGYVQIDPDTDLIEGYYAAAGDAYGDDKTFIDHETGDAGQSVGDVSTPANELIVMRNYSALAPHYGLPDIIPATQTLFGDLAARQFNATFFENDGVPRFAVIVEGGELSEAAWSQLREQFANIRENDNAHRGVLLEAVSAAKSSFEDAHNVSLRIEPLTVGIEEDASFIEYRKENEHDIGKAHSCPPVVYDRTDQINYANAESHRRSSATEPNHPRRGKFAARLYRMLHQTMLGVDGWTLDFVLHGAENEERQANIAKTRIAAGAQGGMLVNEARAELGLDPLDGPEGEMLLSELSGSGNAEAIQNALTAEREAGRQEAEADAKGYSITERTTEAESDD